MEPLLLLLGLLVRAFDDVPHTGVTRYVEGIKKIPAAALGVKSADLLTQALKNNPNVATH